MNRAIGQAITEIAAFTRKHHIDAEFHFHTVEQLWKESEEQSTHWARFEKRPGVYCLFQRDWNQPWYIGKSEIDTGSRVFVHLFKDGKVMDSVGSEDIILSVVLEQEGYMAPALEAYLISQLQPVLNTQGKG